VSGCSLTDRARYLVTVEIRIAHTSQSHSSGLGDFGIWSFSAKIFPQRRHI
jgi:hypothetical protein